MWKSGQVWEVKAADLSISPVHQAAISLVDSSKVHQYFYRVLLRCAVLSFSVCNHIEEFDIAKTLCQQIPSSLCSILTSHVKCLPMNSISLRFPRLVRLHEDKTPVEAASAEQVKILTIPDK
jgi:ATP-dependent DNA ligase